MFTNTVQRWGRCVAALVVVACWTSLSFAQAEKKPEKKPEPAATKTILDVTKGVAELKTFNGLIESAGLAETLKGKGPFTVFAPTDEAFAKMGKELDELKKPENKAKLTRMLKHHILEGKKTVADIKTMKGARTMAGEVVLVTVKDDVLTVEKAKITKGDTDGGNGLIHIVDAVLMPSEEQ